MTGKRRVIVSLVVLALLVVLAYTQFAIFVVPPMGKLPEGKTLVVSRLKKTEFIDSTDAMCERIQGGISPLCRGMVLNYVAERATIYLRLPYSESLYLTSTDAKVYLR